MIYNGDIFASFFINLNAHFVGLSYLFDLTSKHDI